MTICWTTAMLVGCLTQRRKFVYGKESCLISWCFWKGFFNVSFTIWHMVDILDFSRSLYSNFFFCWVVKEIFRVVCRDFTETSSSKKSGWLESKHRSPLEKNGRENRKFWVDERYLLMWAIDWVVYKCSQHNWTKLYKHFTLPLSVLSSHFPPSCP